MTAREHACVVCTECESCRRRICPDPTQETAIHTDCGWMCGLCVEPDADFLRDQERERENR